MLAWRISILALVAMISGTLLTTGCSPVPGSEKPGVGLDDYRVLNGSSFRVQNELRISGRGRVVNSDPLAGINSSQNYDLAFTLEDGGSLTLISNGSGLLDRGVEFTVMRLGSELRATIGLDGGATYILELPETIKANQTIELSLDVHDGEPGLGSHVLVMNGTGLELYDSEVEGHLFGEDGGTGSLWGLVLNNAQVLRARVGEPKSAHE